MSSGDIQKNTNGKIRVPVGDDRALVETLHLILTGELSDPDAISLSKSTRRQLAHALLDARVRGGVDGFWDAYDALSYDRPELQEWRHLVENIKAQAEPPRKRVGVRLSEVEAVPMLWLWPRYIPLGKITMLDGDGGTGKTMLTCHLARCVTRNAPLPDGTLPAVTGGVVLIAPTLIYRITSDREEGDTRPYIEWLGESQHTAETLANPVQKPAVPGNPTLGQKILEVLEEAAPEALSAKQVTTKFTDDEKGSVYTVLRRLLQRGEVVQIPDGNYTVPSSLSEIWSQENNTNSEDV